MKILTYDWHQGRGATFEDFFGCEIPSHYGNYEQEYWAIRKSVGLRDVSHFGKVRMSGRDRQRFLNGMVSNDVKALEPGIGTWALFLDVKGHLQADLKIYAFPNHLLLIMQHYLRDKVIAGLDKYIISEDVTMKDVTEEFALFQILGPDAESFLKSKGIEELPAALFAFRSVSVGGIDANLIRLSAGFALLAPVASAAQLLDHLNAQPIGMRAFDVYRIESGLPLLSRDTDETSLPQEARMDAALNFHKGCYLGQEVMARIDAQGHVNKHLMGIASASPLHPGDKIYKGDKEIGKITSSTTSLLLSQSLALGYVRREFAKEGELVQTGENRITAMVKQLPL